jgi:hypothetical protein
LLLRSLVSSFLCGCIFAVLVWRVASHLPRPQSITYRACYHRILTLSSWGSGSPLSQLFSSALILFPFESKPYEFSSTLNVAWGPHCVSPTTEGSILFHLWSRVASQWSYNLGRAPSGHFVLLQTSQSVLLQAKMVTR